MNYYIEEELLNEPGMTVQRLKERLILEDALRNYSPSLTGMSGYTGVSGSYGLSGFTGYSYPSTTVTTSATTSVEFAIFDLSGLVNYASPEPSLPDP